MKFNELRVGDRFYIPDADGGRHYIFIKTNNFVVGFGGLDNLNRNALAELVVFHIHNKLYACFIEMDKEIIKYN